MSRKEPPPRLREAKARKRERTAEIVARLYEAYPDAQCALTFASPWQLLIATILSAQCTDERVNTVTPVLFERFPTPESMIDTPVEAVEEIVRPTGFYRNKAKNIVAAAHTVVEDFGGEVPRTMDELTQVPGAARKTANVVISNCWPDLVDGIPVDTHVQRIVRRLGLTKEFTPEKVERDLMDLVEREHWHHFTHLVIDHGREICTARTTPHCEACPLNELCPSATRWA